MNSRPSFNHRTLVIGIIAIGALLRFILAILNYPAGDAAWHLANARHIALEGELPFEQTYGRLSYFSTPFLFHVLSAFLYRVFSIFGEGWAEMALKLISPLFGSLTLIVTYLIARKLYDERVGLLSTIFVAFFPLHIYMSSIPYLDSTVTFFVSISIYALLQSREKTSALFMGLAFLSKANALAALPIIAWIIYRKHGFAKSLQRMMVYFTVFLAVSSPFWIRNLVVFHNPVWPFLTNVFGDGGYQTLDTQSFSGFHPSYFLQIGLIVSRTYLGLFGVPNGDFDAFQFAKIPLMPVLLTAWLLMTFLFLIPFFPYLRSISWKRPNTRLIIIWVLCISFVFFLIIAHGSGADIYARFLLPAIVPISMAWAIGANHILVMPSFKNRRPYLVGFLVILIVCFCMAEFIKTGIARMNWQPYQSDYEWIRNEVPPDALFLNGGQALAYATGRQSIFHCQELNLTQYDYAWINQEFVLEHQNIITEPRLQNVMESGELVYYNPITKTSIYKIRK